MSRLIEVRRSPIHGKGLFARIDLPAGKTLIRYRGQLLTHAEADTAYCENVEAGHTFLFVLNDDYVVDGAVDGNIARWINHSCTPNCEPVLWENKDGDRSRDRIFIQTTQAVRAGQELTYNYGIELSVPHTARMKKIWACRCGTTACTGTLLNPKTRRKKG